MRPVGAAIGNNPKTEILETRLLQGVGYLLTRHFKLLPVFGRES